MMSEAESGLKPKIRTSAPTPRGRINSKLELSKTKLGIINAAAIIKQATILNSSSSVFSPPRLN